jgi:hypothetical protein
MSFTPRCDSNWPTTWLAADCDTPLSSAAREKLRRETMSQKTFRDLRFTEIRALRPQDRDLASSVITKTNDAALHHSESK